VVLVDRRETGVATLRVTLDDGTGRPLVVDGAAEFELQVGIFEGLYDTGSLPTPIG
jgi:hypothetical protein